MQALHEKVFDTLETPIGGVPPEHMMTVWPRVEMMLRRVVKPETGYSISSVLTALQMSSMQLWVVGDFQAIVVTRIENRPLFNVLWVQFLAGEHLAKWLDDLIAVVEAYARHHNCRMVEFSGRHGWNRLQPKHPDYKPVLTTFRKELHT
jgi:hypothetical protein